MTETNKKGIKKKITEFRYRIRRSIKWHYKYYSLKYPFFVLRIRNSISVVVYTALILFVLWCLLFNSGIIEYDGHFIIGENGALNNIQPFNLVSSQVSITLIVVSICSLTGGLENKYILGKNAIELLFRHKWIFKLYLIIIFLLTAINLYLMVSHISNSLIFSIYIISFALIAIYAFRFAKLFISNNSVKASLMHTYYKLNLKHLKKERPNKHYHFRELEDFKNITIKYIREDNVLKYSENFDVYYHLLEISLFRHRELIQEYYTELMDFNDFISNIIEFCWELLKKDKEKESLKLFNGLLNITNYYRIIISNHYAISNLISQYIEYIKYMKTELEVKQYSDTLLTMIKNLVRSVYLSTVLDFSYCRLYGDDLFIFGPSNDYLEKYYLYIYDNKHISLAEKRCLYREFAFQIRTLESNLFLSNYDIDDFLNKRIIHSKEKISDEIWGEQLSKLILKMYENKDSDNIEMIIHNITSDSLKCFVVTVTTLSISEMLIRNNKRIYAYDLDIEPEFALHFLQNTKILQLDVNIDVWVNTYKLVQKLIIKDHNSDTKSIYHFSPQLSFFSENVYYYFKTLLGDKPYWKDFVNQSKIKIEQNPRVEKIYDSYRNKALKVKVKKISKNMIRNEK